MYSRRRRRRIELPDTGHAKNYTRIAYDYARACLLKRNRNHHGELERLAAERFLDDLEAPPSSGFVFRPWYGNNVCDFVEKLPHTKGRWATPTITLEPVQCFLLVNLFGFRQTDAEHFRRFEQAYVEIARKGAKTTIAAAIALYVGLCEGEPGAEVLIGATSLAQACKVFDPAALMCKRTPDLREAFSLEVYAKSIYSGPTASVIKPIHAKSDNQDGWNPSAAVLDELHAHKDRGLFDVLRSAFGSRDNPLFLTITTAGRSARGVCFEQRTMAQRVLEGAAKLPHFFAMIWTLDKGDDPLDSRVWRKANPMLGVTPSRAYVEKYAKEARESPAARFEFAVKQMNVWSGAPDAWLNHDRWIRAARVSSTAPDVSGWSVAAGMDLSSRLDLTALVLCFASPKEHGVRRYHFRGRYFLPEESVDQYTRDRNLQYREWVDAGFITATPGSSVDLDFVELAAIEMLGLYNVGALGFDPWRAQQIVEHLRKERAPLVEMRQGPKTYDPPMRELEAALADGRVTYEDPVFGWAGTNVVARTDANMNQAPDRKRSTEKIDPIVAGLMALNGHVAGIVRPKLSAGAMMP